MGEPLAEALAGLLSQSHWTHDYPIETDEARRLGLLIGETMSLEVYALMELYPQQSSRRPSVVEVPPPYPPSPRDPTRRQSI